MSSVCLLSSDVATFPDLTHRNDGQNYGNKIKYVFKKYLLIVYLHSGTNGDHGAKVGAKIFPA